MINRGSPADHRSRRYIMRNAALGDRHRSVPNPDVPRDTDLPQKNDVIAYIRRAREADLRAKKGIVPDSAAVPDVDQVIDLGTTTDAGLPDAGAVNAGVRLNFYVAINDDIS